MVKCSNGDEDCRSFTVLGSGISFEGGYYKAKTPSIAAQRAGSKLFQKPEYKSFPNKNTIKFILGEKTRGSEKKTWAWEVKRTKLSKPKEIKRGDVTITIKYEFKVYKLENTDKEISNLREVIEKKGTDLPITRKTNRNTKKPNRLIEEV
jgi:hypothetical protein